jgi:DNA-binding beta-propeller fold protein YncE
MRPVDLTDSPLDGLAGTRAEAFNGKMLLIRPPAGTTEQPKVVTFDGTVRQLTTADSDTPVVFDPEQTAWYVRDYGRENLQARVFALDTAGNNMVVRNAPTFSHILAATDTRVAVASPGTIFILDHRGEVVDQLDSIEPLIPGRGWFLAFTCDTEFSCGSMIVPVDGREPTPLQWRSRISGSAVLSLDGLRMAVSNGSGTGTILVIDATTGDVTDTRIPAVAAGSFVFSGRNNNVLIVDAGREIIVSDLAAGTSTSITEPTLSRTRTLVPVPHAFGPFPTLD